MKRYIIEFTGIQGLGKTTIFNLLKRTNLSDKIDFFDFNDRKYFDDTVKKMNFKKQLFLFGNYIRKEINNYKGVTLFLYEKDINNQG